MSDNGTALRFGLMECGLVGLWLLLMVAFAIHAASQMGWIHASLFW